jgi:hypothetical protein
VTTAQALLAASYLAIKESDDYAYRLPRLPDDQAEAARLADVSDDLALAADAAGAIQGEDWRAAVAWCEGETVDPGFVSRAAY